MKGSRRRIVFGTLGAIVVVALLIAIFHDPILKAAVPPIARAAGYDVSLGSLHLGSSELELAAVDVKNPAGEPIATIDRVRVGFALADLLPGGKTLFGLRSVDIERPHITLIHHLDGSYNIAFPKSSGPTSNAPLAPLDATIHIADGSASIVDDGRLYRESRRLGVEHLNVDGTFAPGAPSSYDVHLALVEDGRSYPVDGHGDLDDGRGIENNRVRAAEIPIGPLVDYALNTATVHITRGSLVDLDARYYGLRDHSGTIVRHLGVSGRVVNFTLQLGFLAKPLRDGNGEVFAYDDGLTIPKLHGTVADVPVTVAGAIYDFAKPTFRLGVAGSGRLAQLVTLAAAAKKLPVSGDVGFGLLVVGDATAPLTFARFASPRIVYEKYPFDGAHGLVAIYGPDTTVLDAALSYGGIALGTRGNLTARKHTDLDFLANVTARASDVPYADTLLPGMTIGAQAIASGTDAKLETAGIAFGDTALQHLAGLFQLAPSGVGEAGPLLLEGTGGESLLADVAIDRPGGGISALVDARHLRLGNSRLAGLPGISLPVLPPFAVALDASLGAVTAKSQTAVAGTAGVHDASLRGIPLGDVALDATALSGAHPDRTRVAVRGTYSGRLDDLARLGGGSVPAHGNISLGFGALAIGTDAVATVRDTRLDRVSLDGVTLQGLDATVGLHGKNFSIYEARAALGPGTVVASGSIGSGGTISVATNAIDLAKLSAVPDLPVRQGTVQAVATIGGTSTAPTLDAGVVASNIRYRQYAAGGSTSLAYAGDRLTIASGLFDLAGAVANLDGSVTGLRPGAIHPELDVTASANAVDIAALAAAAHASSQYPTGSIDANLRVTGSASAPAIAGRVAIPEGSINGLDYRDAAVGISGNAREVRAEGGTVTIGGSRIGFGGDVSPAMQRVTLSAPHLNLADFNDYFDAADTLGGSGNFALALTHDADHLNARATTAMSGLQLRRIPLGDARAYVNTSGRTITTNARVGDARGIVALSGGVTLPASQLQRDTIHRTNVALSATATRIDLERWLPVFGIAAPVAGFASANARVNGTYPNLAIATTARLDGGRIGNIPVTEANLDARSSRGRVTITSAIFNVPNLSTTIAGSAGLRPGDPIDLRVRSTTADVGAVASTFGLEPRPDPNATATATPKVAPKATPSGGPTAAALDISGAAQIGVSVAGTLARPNLDATVDAQQLRYTKYTVPRVHAEAAVADLTSNNQRGRIELRGTEVDLNKGRITASGSAPFEARPAPGLGPRNAPVTLALAVEGVDLGQFGVLLPKNTKLAGDLAGSFALGGTVGAPTNSGTLSVTHLSYIGPQEAQQITNGTVALSLTDRTLAITTAHVESGGGSIDLSGHATVADLQNPAASTTFVTNAVFNHPVLQLPNLYKGRIDGNLGVSRTVADAPPLVSGSITASEARIPYTALLPPQTTGTPGPTPPPVNLALGVTMGKDVRVQSGPVDIGAQGHIDVTGTVSSPKASGKFVATGGTVDFYRDFRLQNGIVAFDPENGVIPSVTAEATTSIQSPATDVTLNVTGLATSLNVGLTSDPSYSKEQILGLLVGLNNFGAVSGVAAGASGPAPTAGSLASNYATGQISTLFQRNLLEPLSANVGQAVGLSTLGVNYNPGGGLDLSAKKQIIKHVDAVFAETFGYPQRTSYGLLAEPSDSTGIQLTLFQQAAANQFDIAPQALQSTNNAVTGAEPQRGQNGYSFSLQRRF